MPWFAWIHCTIRSRARAEQGYDSRPQPSTTKARTADPHLPTTIGSCCEAQQQAVRPDGGSIPPQVGSAPRRRRRALLCCQSTAVICSRWRDCSRAAKNHQSCSRGPNAGQIAMTPPPHPVKEVTCDQTTLRNGESRALEAYRLGSRACGRNPHTLRIREDSGWEGTGGPGKDPLIHRIRITLYLVYSDAEPSSAQGAGIYVRFPSCRSAIPAWSYGRRQDPPSHEERYVMRF